MLKRWEVTPRAPASHFDRFPDLPRLVIQILYNRGFTEPDEVRTFLTYHWPDDDPFQLKGMAEAVERLTWAIKRQQPIAIYGDYDADGTA